MRDKLCHICGKRMRLKTNAEKVACIRQDMQAQIAAEGEDRRQELQKIALDVLETARRHFPEGAPSLTIFENFVAETEVPANRTRVLH